MNFFKRIFKVGQAEAHSLVDKLEDPIKLTEQGIRDLKKDLDSSLKALAEVKALSIRAKRDSETAKDKSAHYERKATQLIEQAQSGQIEATEADRLATECLLAKQKADKDYSMYSQQHTDLEKRIQSLESNIKKLKSKINQYESELKSLKARARVAEATGKINKQMANIDSGGTISMLERMKEKVDQKESLAEAYGDIADENKSIDEEIDSALNSDDVDASSALADLKAKMNKNS